MEHETFKIRTHQQCVKDEKIYCKEHNLNLSLIDLEAIVEQFLIVDLNALVSYNSEAVSNKIVFPNVSVKQQRFLEALLRGYCSLSIALPNVIKFFQSLIDITNYDNTCYFDDKRFSEGHAFKKNTHDLEKLSSKSLIDKKQHELIERALEKVFEKTTKISDD